MKTQITAAVFWRLYQETSTRPEEVPEIEHMRHRCLLGFTALDAALFTFWESSVLPEWDETMSLVSMALDSPTSSETLEELAVLAGPYLKKSQLVATLRFLANTGEASRFTPNFLDFASYLLLRQPESEETLKAVRLLCELQSSRNSAVHTGRPWSEIQAHRSLKLIEETASVLSGLGRNFRDAFGEEAPLETTKKTVRAA
jgi:hypothetical protein